RWPGNVRELQNVIRRGIAMTRGNEIGVEDLPDTIVAAAGDRPASNGGGSTAAPSTSGQGAFFEERARRIAAFEKEYLSAKLAEHQGDVTSAAREAGIPRGTFYRLMKNHGLKATDYRD